MVQIVMPQNWLFLTSYKNNASRCCSAQFNEAHIARASAFQTPMWDFNAQLLTVSRARSPGRLCAPWHGRQRAQVGARKSMAAARGRAGGGGSRAAGESGCSVVSEEAVQMELLAKYADGLAGIFRMATPQGS